jgi:hypothetical protein
MPTVDRIKKLKKRQIFNGLLSHRQRERDFVPSAGNWNNTSNITLILDPLSQKLKMKKIIVSEILILCLLPGKLKARTGY